MIKKEDIFQHLNNALDEIQDEKVKQVILSLFTIIEEQASQIKALQEENQKLRDENNALKGEKGKPNIKPKNQTDKETNNDYSSEKERRKKNKTRKKRSKKNKITINHTQKCYVDPKILPDDAKFKGYKSVTVQDIEIIQNNIEFQKEVFYSASLNKTFTAELPPGYEGDFGPTIKSLIIILNNLCNVSEPKIFDLLESLDFKISKGSISNKLIKDKEQFHKEKDDIYLAGLASHIFQQIDDTGSRVNGENHYTQIVCNPLHTSYFTTKRKDRLTILDVLRNFKKRSFCFNDETFQLLKKLKVPQKIINNLMEIEKNKNFSEKEIDTLLKKYAPDVGKNTKTRIMEAAAIASYHILDDIPIIKILLSDDAKQFKLLTKLLALCWIHDGRHYKKLRPIVPYHRKILAKFLDDYWKFYRKLMVYKKYPTEKGADKLSKDFDELFLTKTSYNELNARIEKTNAKKEELLLVLKYPELPLHNNDSELGARVQVRKRDVSLQTRTDEGTKAKDTFLTIIQTAKKLGVNVYDYLFDRISQKYELVSLADIIQSKSVQI